MKLFLLLAIVFCSYELSWKDYWQIAKTEKCSIHEFICKNCTAEVNETRIVETFDNKATTISGYIAVNEYYKIILVVFRATWSFTNWLQNFDLFQRGNVFGNRLKKGAKIHRGYYNAWVSVQNELLMKLGKVENNYKEYPIVFIGHSLGASLAVLASIGYHLSDYPYQKGQLSVVAFGQTRLGNKEFAETLNELPYASRYHRIVAEGDVVAALPPKAFNYYHSTGQKTIFRNGKMAECREDEVHNARKTCLKPVWKSNAKNHLNYFGIPLPCK